VKVLVDEASRAELEKLVRAHKTPKDLARRAQVVSEPAGGASFAATVRKTKMREPHVRKWVGRFLQQGLAGLNDRPRPGRPPGFSPRGRSASGPPGLQPAGPVPVAVAVGLP
jgi:hypothetical protein